MAGAQVEQEVENLEKMKAKLQEDVYALELERKKLEERIGTNTDYLRAQGKIEEGVKKRLKGLEERQTELERASVGIGKSAAHLADLEQKVKTLQKEKKSADEKSDYLMEQVKQLSAELQKSKDEKDKLRRDAWEKRGSGGEEGVAQVKKLEEKNSALEKQISDVLEEKGKVDERIRKLTEEKKAVSDENERIASTLAESERRVRELSGVVEELRRIGASRPKGKAKEIERLMKKAAKAGEDASEVGLAAYSGEKLMFEVAKPYHGIRKFAIVKGRGGLLDSLRSLVVRK